MTGAEDLDRAGYWWESADAPILHRALGLADLGHLLELDRLAVVPAAARDAVLDRLLTLLDAPWPSVAADSSGGEPYLARERYLRGLVGDDVGWLRAGRTRREAMRTAVRIVVRTQVLDLVDAACELATALAGRAEEHLGTVMPDHTYLQQAQPTTFGHYLLSFADPVLRDADRLLVELDHVNGAPTGAGAANGSPVLVERDRPARALGFGGAIEHTRDAMWQVDPFLHVLTAATSLLLTQDGLAEDLEILASAEFGFLALAEQHSRPSVLMPQKRNPYALSVVRGSTGVAIGRLTGQLALAKSPSARSDRYIYLYGELPRTLDLVHRVTSLTVGVVGALTPDAARMRAALDLGFTQAADLAHLLMTATGADYGTAHRVVADLIADLDARGRGPAGIESAAVAAAATRVTGRPWVLDPDDLAAVLDPDRLIASRVGVGGAAPGPMRAMIARITSSARDLRAGAGTVRASIEQAEAEIVARATATQGRTRR